MANLKFIHHGITFNSFLIRSTSLGSFVFIRFEDTFFRFHLNFISVHSKLIDSTTYTLLFFVVHFCNFLWFSHSSNQVFHIEWNSKAQNTVKIKLRCQLIIKCAQFSHVCTTKNQKPVHKCLLTHSMSTESNEIKKKIKTILF